MRLLIVFRSSLHSLTGEHRAYKIVEAVALRLHMPSHERYFGWKGDERSRAWYISIFFQVNPETLKLQCCLSLALLEDAGASWWTSGRCKQKYFRPCGRPSWSTAIFVQEPWLLKGWGAMGAASVERNIIAPDDATFAMSFCIKRAQHPEATVARTTGDGTWCQKIRDPN